MINKREKKITTLYHPTMLERFQREASTPAEATWTCARCGTLLPTKIVLGDLVRYARRRCACQQEQENARLRAQQQAEWLEAQSVHCYSWLGADWTDPRMIGLRYKTFNNFDARYQLEAYEVAQAYAADPCGVLVLYGTYGTGKTHLLAAICNELLKNKHMSSLFTTSPKLFAAIQGQIQADESYSYILERAIKTPLLVFDDVDKAKWSEFREERYFDIIDERINAGLPVALSTNRLDRLAEYVGGAVCSRLKINQIAVEMVGQDYREVL